ncbi:MAG: TlpA family protein disulfide reductase [Gammaproteobacteria bacterium]|jgi:peroxiredoxin|nr:TlpA family protein disulfide reductase [Gammaproteobacteria bacterium]MBT7306947.1 TlpA family protein disulfide reductase [Gammaproteobacteria bacterium]
MLPPLFPQPLIPRLLLALCLFSTPLTGHTDFSVADEEGNELQIRVMAAEGELVTLWFSDLVEEERPHFQQLLESIQQSGVEVWSSRILEDLFLTRDDKTVMALDGRRIARIIEAAQQHTRKKILLLSYDRMSIPLLRGVRIWQQNHPDEHSLSGVALLYPNLFIAPERAGDAAEPAPILSLTNIPVALFQPEKGQHAKRISQVMERLWRAGSAATLYPLADIRDWYIMHDPSKNPAERRIRGQLPRQLHQLAQQLEQYTFPTRPIQQALTKPVATEVDLYRLTPITERPTAPDFTLQSSSGETLRLSQLHGKIVLINFWASWCPPCVEEIPSMNALYRRYSAQGLEILAINFQETQSEVSAFMKKVKIDFPVLLDRDGTAAHQWNVFSLPSSFLIDRDGRVRYSVSRSIYWNRPEIFAILDKLTTE